MTNAYSAHPSKTNIFTSILTCFDSDFVLVDVGLRYGSNNELVVVTCRIILRDT